MFYVGNFIRIKSKESLKNTPGVIEDSNFIKFEDRRFGWIWTRGFYSKVLKINYVELHQDHENCYRAVNGLSSAWPNSKHIEEVCDGYES